MVIVIEVKQLALVKYAKYLKKKSIKCEKIVKKLESL